METLDGHMAESTGITGEKTKLKVDLIVQSSLLGIGLLTALAGVFEITFFAFYFGIGAYQLVTSLVHLKFQNHTTGRKFYWPQLIIHALTFLSLTFVKDPISILVFILFSTGFTAFYYYFLTLFEYGRSQN